jgi:hypothetical protein
MNQFLSTLISKRSTLITKLPPPRDRELLPSSVLGWLIFAAMIFGPSALALVFIWVLR